MLAKTCPKCLENKPKEEFHRYTANKDGLRNVCKKCENSQRRTNPSYNSAFRAKKWRDGNLDHCRRYGRNRLKVLKQHFLDMYGRCCNCCGDSREFALTIDHVKPVLSKGRRSKDRFREALSEYRPDLFQTLCANCNFKKGKNSKCNCGTKVLSVCQYEDCRDG